MFFCYKIIGSYTYILLGAISHVRRVSCHDLDERPVSPAAGSEEDLLLADPPGIQGDLKNAKI